VAPFGDLKPVKKFTDRKTAVTRIWQAIQKLDEEVMRTSIRDAEGKLKDAQQHNAPAAPQAAQSAPAKPGHPHQEGTQSQKGRQERQVHQAFEGRVRAPRGHQDCPGGRPPSAEERRDLDRDHGQDGLAKTHRRGFMAGAMKKAGYTVESFKPEGGERTYRII
jgi:hypothetical protein